MALQTATMTAAYSVGGVAFTATVEKTAEGGSSQVVPLPAAVVGTISALGVDNLATGHGIAAAATIDVHWVDVTDGVTRRVRRGLLVDTSTANDITFDETPAGVGDTLPAPTTVCWVAVQVIIDVDFDGDLIEMLAQKSDVVCQMDIRDATTSLKSMVLPAKEGWSYIKNYGYANPFAVKVIDKIVVTNGGITVGTYQFGLLYQSVS